MKFLKLTSQGMSDGALERLSFGIAADYCIMRRESLYTVLLADFVAQARCTVRSRLA